MIVGLAGKIQDMIHFVVPENKEVLIKKKNRDIQRDIEDNLKELLMAQTVTI